MIDDLLFRGVEVDGTPVDVLVTGGQVGAVGRDLDVPERAEVIDGHGGALLPGLHDHHVHLLAMGAVAASVDVRALDGDGFVTALRSADARARRGEWLRVIGYHEASHGALDRVTLDAIVPGRPVRVQHATGALWVLSSTGLTALPVDDAPDGLVERDADGDATGRLFGLDEWLSRTLGREPPDLTGVGLELASYGVTGVTDATPYRAAADLDHLSAAVTTGTLRQRVVVTGAPELDRTDLGRLTAGPAKVVVPDHDPPDVDALAAEITTARGRGLAVAFHCASRLALVLTVAALEQTGAAGGDRIEHGAVIPLELVPRLRALGVTVVTQPAFVHERGDRYLAEVEADDVPHLWRAGSLLAAGIPVGFGSDAPHGPADPWLGIRAATERRTRSGRALGLAERMNATEALARSLASWSDPGGAPRRVVVGAPADLCLLRVPLTEALAAPSAGSVRVTTIDGVVCHRA